MTAEQRYSTPAAFRRALTDRLRAAAQETKWTLPQLQRQVAYDRLLERLYLVDDGWIVKGATALLARDLGVRGSLDIDIYREAARDVAEGDLRHAARLDIGDWFRFEVGNRTPIGEASMRLSIDAVIGGTTWAAFHVDLVGSDLRMTGQPEVVPPLVRGVIPEVEQRGYKAYPLVDHVADKVAATYERHGAMAAPSTRFRDLVDLVSIASGASIEAIGLRVAIQSEFDRRGIPLPGGFDVPDHQLWASGYAAEARRSLLSIGHTLDEALELVRRFVDPVLQDSAVGTWDNREHRWSE